MPSVVTFAQLPEESAEFIAYLQTTGDVWARAVNDDPRRPQYEPLPIAEFLDRFADAITAYDVAAVYLAFREDIGNPAILSHELMENGVKVQRDTIDPMGSPFVRYDRGGFRSENELAESNLCFYPGTYKDATWSPNPPGFMKWGKKVLDWMRRHTPSSVPVHRRRDKLRATVGVEAACKAGLKVC